jgi:hypothetical protein
VCCGRRSGAGEGELAGHVGGPEAAQDATQAGELAGVDEAAEAADEGEGDAVGGGVALALGRGLVRERGPLAQQAVDQAGEVVAGGGPAGEQAQGELVDLGLGLELEGGDGAFAADGLDEVEEVAEALDDGEGVGEGGVAEDVGGVLEALEGWFGEGEGDLDAGVGFADEDQLVAGAVGGEGDQEGGGVDAGVGAVEGLEGRGRGRAAPSLQGVRGGATEDDAGGAEAAGVAGLAVAAPAVVEAEEVAVTLAAAVGGLGDHLGGVLEAVGEGVEDGQGAAAVGDLAVGGGAEGGDVAEVDGGAVEAVGDHAGDEEGAVAEDAEGLGAGAAGFGAGGQVLQGERAAAAADLGRLADKGGQQVNDVSLDLAGEVGPGPGLGLADLVEEEGLERTIQRDFAGHCHAPHLSKLAGSAGHSTKLCE